MLISIIRQMFSGGAVDISSLLAYIVSVFFIIFLILPLHEFAHGFVANKLGDPTAKLEGRLTFNPLASIDVQGAFWLMFFGFGWAKPVPVDSRYFKKPKRDLAITAFAGPFSNFLAALLGAFIYCTLVVTVPQVLFSANSYSLSFLGMFLNFYITVNISLAVFNLLPIPPLDGSKIFAAFLPDKFLYSFRKYERIFMMALFFLLLGGALSGPLGVAQNFLLKIVMNIASAPFKLFGAM